MKDIFETWLKNNYSEGEVKNLTDLYLDKDDLEGFLNLKCRWK